jgi:hypothetical protein
MTETVVRLRSTVVFHPLNQLVPVCPRLAMSKPEAPKI